MTLVIPNRKVQTSIRHGTAHGQNRTGIIGEKGSEWNPRRPLQSLSATCSTHSPCRWNTLSHFLPKCPTPGRHPRHQADLVWRVSYIFARRLNVFVSHRNYCCVWTVHGLLYSCFLPVVTTVPQYAQTRNSPLKIRISI